MISCSPFMTDSVEKEASSLGCYTDQGAMEASEEALRFNDTLIPHLAAISPTDSVSTSGYTPYPLGVSFFEIHEPHHRRFSLAMVSML